MMRSSSAYDRIGVGYSRHRQPDPRWQAAIRRTIGDATSVLNVGAGTGSYEPRELDVVAVEPSSEMARQRPPDAAPVVRGVAERLPFARETFDVATALLTIHHWSDWRTGLDELQRVASRQVLLTFDMDVVAEAWLLAHYLPEIADFDANRTPSVEELCAHLGGADVMPLLVPADMQDAVMLAHWNRPEAYLDAGVRAVASGFAQSPRDVVDRFVSQLGSDLSSGGWDDRFGHLRDDVTHDAGYRLVVAG